LFFRLALLRSRVRENPQA